MVKWHNPFRLSVAILPVAMLLMAVCGDVFFKEERLCKVKGYSYWYRGETRIEENIPETVEFSLVVLRFDKHLKINANGLFPEHNNALRKRS